MNSTLSLFGLVLLLLLSPCKVRNFIQNELGIPQTKVLNKSQSSISESNCETFEFSETIQTVTNPTFQQPGFLISEASQFDFTTYLLGNTFNLNTSKNQQVSDVPLYILYQNLKVYS
ncbi:hypothetical protein Q4566_13310 [Tamlana sp. 2_MG-2023]|uniref:hypothetical protein n=1 Tax=unclassified Tamlana TaxID=2614803 RepID=UPI0026E2A86F|nr:MULTISPECIES: hypothetical protein [unclassified Tamlana]MDO6761183.1 hypothetical protein [Tamlana sp. 2_MG-2023]MDO6791484.1 hypothetical protein [Tamlana sp. 1_MG-2023]